MALVNRCIASGRNIIGEPGNGLFRTALIETIGDYDDQYPYVIDLDYWFRILAYGDAYYTANVTSAFRIHPEAWTNKLGWKQFQDYTGMIKRFSRDPNYKLTLYSRLSGYMRALINTPLRRIVYAFMLK